MRNVRRRSGTIEFQARPRLRGNGKRGIFPLIVAAMLCLVAGCGGGGGETVITVFAAASLNDAFQDIAREFEAEHRGVEVRLNFAGSQRLRSQLEFGAAADVFASANELQMSLAENAGLLRGNSQTFASAPMAVIVSSNSGIGSLNELAAPGVKLVLAHESVPAGQYSRRMLARLSGTEFGLGGDFVERVLARVVSEETSVKFVEQKVVLGQADAGIVYRPGALTAVATGAARKLPLPPEASEVRADYPIAVLRESSSPEWAARFIEFVLAQRAQDILAGYGFGSP